MRKKNRKKHRKYVECPFMDCSLLHRVQGRKTNKSCIINYVDTYTSVDVGKYFNVKQLYIFILLLSILIIYTTIIVILKGEQPIIKKNSRRGRAEYISCSNKMAPSLVMPN
jgi:hypothetical protein